MPPWPAPPSPCIEATGEAAYLRPGHPPGPRRSSTHFAAPDGGYFTSADDAEDVLVRGRTAGDNATPSGNGIMAEVQAQLFHLTGDDRWRIAAEATIGAFTGHEGLAAMPGLLVAADLLTEAADGRRRRRPRGPAPQPWRPSHWRIPTWPSPCMRARDGAALPVGHPAHGKAAVDGTRRGLCLPRRNLRPAGHRPGVAAGGTRTLIYLKMHEYRWCRTA